VVKVLNVLQEYFWFWLTLLVYVSRDWHWYNFSKCDYYSVLAEKLSLKFVNRSQLCSYTWYTVKSVLRGHLWDKEKVVF